MVVMCRSIYLHPSLLFVRVQLYVLIPTNKGNKSLPVNDDGVGGGFVTISTTLLVTASTAHHFVREEDPTHLRILVLAFVGNCLEEQCDMFKMFGYEK
jgi:hypothetical protein